MAGAARTSDRAALPTAKIPRRSRPRSFQTGSEAWEMFFEPLGNVIRVEDGELRERVHGLNFKMLSAQPISMCATARKEINLRVRQAEQFLTAD